MHRSRRQLTQLESLETRRMPAAITVAPVQVTAGTTDTAATFTATLDEATTSPVTLTYSTTNGTARAGRDYTATASSVTIPAGSTSATFTVPVSADTVAGKATEKFYLNLKTSAGNTLAARRVAATIVDGLAQPVVTASDLTITEPTTTNASKTGTVTISLSTPSAKAVRVSYSTTDGTAVSAGKTREYVARAGSVVIRAGATSVKLPVRVYGRATSDETFNVTLRSATGATLSTVRPGGVYGRVVVQDSATAATNPTVTVSSPTVTTGDAATFNVTLSSAATTPVSFRYTTSAGTSASGDITPVNNVLTIPAGQTTGSIVVQTNANSSLTAGETFNLNLSSPANATLASSSVTATINPTALETVPPTFTLPNVTLLGNTTTAFATGTTTAGFTLTLSAASTTPVTVNYTTIDGTAVAGTDYTATSGSVTFAPGVTTALVSVLVTGETSTTQSKTLGLLLTSATNATLADRGAVSTIAYTSVSPGGGGGTMTTTPTVTLTAGTATVGATGTATLPFTLTLSAASTTPISVQYATFNGSAIAGTDYTATSGTATFAAGQTTQTINVTVNGETTSSTTKTVGLTISGPTTASLANTQAGGTITYTSQPTSTTGPGITLQGGTVSVGTAGTAELPFTITLSAASSQTVTVAYSTLDGSAVAGTDYTATTGTATFAPGTTSVTVDIPVNGETSTTTSKTLTLQLTNAVNGEITANTSAGTITYTSATVTPEVDVSSPSIVVTAGTPSTLTFNVILSSKSANVVTATYTTADGTAVAGTDYTATTGTLTFAAGVDSLTVTVPLLGAASDVTSKTFNLNITATTNASNTTGTGVGTLNYTITGTPNIVSNNLGNTTGGVDTSTGTTYNAASFTTTATSTFNSATLLLDSTDGGTAQVGVFTDGGGIPGTLVGFLSSTGTLTSTATATTFTSASGLVLSANTTYWIVLIAPTGSVDWSYTTEDTGAGAGFTNTWAQTADSGSDWFAYNSSPVQMSVSVTPTALGQ